MTKGFVTREQTLADEGRTCARARSLTAGVRMGPPLRSRPRAGAWRSSRAACSGSGSGSDAWALSDDEGAQVAPATRSPRPPALLRPLEAPLPSLHPGAVWEIGGGDEARGVATPSISITACWERFSCPPRCWGWPWPS